MNSRYSRYYTFIKPITRNRYVRTYSSLSFSLIAIMIFVIFAIKPTISTILVLQKQIDNENQTLNSLTKKAQDLSNARDKLKAIDQDTKDKLDTLLPDQTDATTLSDSLTTLALSHNASVSGLQFQPIDLVGHPNKLSKSPSLKEINFTLNLTGGYSDLVATLKALVDSPRLVVLDSVNVTEAGDNSLVMSINGRGFFLQN